MVQAIHLKQYLECIVNDYLTFIVLSIWTYSVYLVTLQLEEILQDHQE